MKIELEDIKVRIEGVRRQREKCALSMLGSDEFDDAMELRVRANQALAENELPKLVLWAERFIAEAKNGMIDEPCINYEEGCWDCRMWKLINELM